MEAPFDFALIIGTYSTHVQSHVLLMEQKAEGFSLSITTVIAEILLYSLFIIASTTFLLSRKKAQREKFSPRWASASLG